MRVYFPTIDEAIGTQSFEHWHSSSELATMGAELLGERRDTLSAKVDIEFYLLIGSKLVHESDLPTALPEGLATDDFLDGALRLQQGDEIFLDERFWDRLDESLCRLIVGFIEAQKGEANEIELPDTRLTIELEPHGDNASVLMEYKERSLPIAETLAELRACARRLVERLEGSGVRTPHSERLKELCSGEG